MNGVFPAAGMYSTVTDLGRFIKVLLNGGRGPAGQVLKRETLREMWKPSAGPEDWCMFGIGFMLGSLDRHRMAGHDGQIYGFATSLDVLPDDQLGAAVVTTMDKSTGVTGRIVREALRLMLAARAHKSLPRIPATTPVGQELARRLQGSYMNDWTRTLWFDLAERDGRLFLLLTQGGYQMELRRLGDRLIVDDRMDYGTEFRLKEDGLQARLPPFERINALKPPRAPPQWAGPIGEYGEDHEVLNILEKDGKLFALIEWLEYHRLVQVSDDIFSFPDPGSFEYERATFQRDAEGYATQVSIGEIIFKRRPEVGKEKAVFYLRAPEALEDLRACIAGCRSPARTR